MSIGTTLGLKNLNNLAGGLASSAVSFAFTGNATFNILNLTDFGTRINGGLLEFTIGKDGVSSKIGNGGTNISYSNIKSSIVGIKEASKVTDWKYGSLESSSTMNSINMLAYTNSKDNLKIAKDIWNENLAVEYGNTGNDYGNYTLGDSKIMLSDNLLGGGRAGSAKLASVMSHEGTHYYGNRVEAIAHMSAAETYSQLNQKFKLQADTSFSMEMLAGIMNTDNWKENTGDVDHWTLMANGDLVEDEDGWLRDENGNFIRDKDGNKIGANGIETGLLNILFGEKQSDGSMKNQGKNYTAFTDEQISIAQGLMYGAGFTNDGKENPRDVKWNQDENSGNTIKADLIADAAGNTVATMVFMNIFDETISSMLFENTSLPSLFNTNYRERFYDYADARWQFHISMISEIEKFNNIYSTEEFLYGPDTEDIGESDSFHKGYDKNIKYEPLYMQFSGKIVELDSSGLPKGDWKNTSGKNVNYEIGFMYENLFISTGIQNNSFHLDSVSSNLNLNNFYSAGTYFGISGNTGFSTGAHIHTELVAQSNYINNAYYSQNIQDYFLNYIGAPTIDNFTNNSSSWNNYQNFYSDTYSNIYINTNNLWRKK